MPACTVQAGMAITIWTKVALPAADQHDSPVTDWRTDCAMPRHFELFPTRTNKCRKSFHQYRSRYYTIRPTIILYQSSRCLLYEI